jgi:ABC-type polysaccharide/polyol phosphate transport system ATPase subunit
MSAAPGTVSFTDVGLDYRIFHDRTVTLFDTLLNIFGRRTRIERLRALENASFRISPGESVALVGPNGAGKSSMLKLLAGIYEPSSGIVEVSGRVASLLDLGVGFHPELTGEENLYLNGALLGFDRAAMRKLLPGIAEFAELERFLDTPVKYYSSGMFMRLGFSLATACDPDVLLIDEVLAVGDASFQKKCYDRIYGFKGTGKTIVFVSHDSEAVLRLCERAIRLDRGHVLMDGPAADVMADYLSDASSRHMPAAVSPREWGTREVWFEKVMLTDEGGLPSSSFRTGMKLAVRATLRTRFPAGVNGVVFGFSVCRPDGEQVIGVNNLELNQPLLAFRDSAEVELLIDLDVLEPGSYLLGLALTDPVGRRDYHWQDWFYPLLLLGDRKEPPMRLREAFWTVRAVSS